jgi:hypothetical protein
MKKNAIVSLLRCVAIWGFCVPAAHGAVVFTAGSGTVVAGGNVSVPITVSGFTDVTSFQFSLQWNEDVIEYSSVGSYGLTSMSSGSFGTSYVTSGALTVSWNYDATTVDDGWTLFAVTFTAIGGIGTRSDVSFTNFPTPREVTVNYGVVDPDWIDGGVTVVPEPVNVALGVFGGLLVSAMTLRWIGRKRLARTAG